MFGPCAFRDGSAGSIGCRIPIGYRRSDVSVTDIRHDLFVYETDTEFAAQVERFAVAGLEADEAVTLTVSAR